MTEVLLRMLLGITFGLGLTLALRRPARRVFGAGPAFTLWLLPVALMLVPLLPRGFAPTAAWSLPAMLVTAQAGHADALSHATSFDWSRGLVALWIAGAALGVLRLVIHYVRLLGSTHRAPVSWKETLRAAAPALDSRRVRVHGAGPAVLWALPHSLILLPADFEQRFDDAATRELVLRHELTHAHRGDAWWSLAMEIASALLWFHPLTWLARPRFRLDQELACDAASLRAAPRCRAGYARALLDSVGVQPAPALIPWLAEPQLKERIAMLTRIPPGALRRRVGFLTIAAVLAAGVYLAGGNAAVRAAAPGSPSTPPSVDIGSKNSHPPRYPAEALRKHEQGEVSLDVTVDAHGNVTGVAVDTWHSTAPAVLQLAALAAATNWKFHPGMERGRPVGGVVRIPVMFSMSPIGMCPKGKVHATKAPFRCEPVSPGTSSV